MTIETIRIDDRYEYVFDEGRVSVRELGGNKHRVEQGAKILIHAANEIDDHEHDRALLHEVLGGCGYKEPEPVQSTAICQIEGTKYAVVDEITGTSILRHGENWIGPGEVELPGLWRAVAAALTSARECTAYLKRYAAERHLLAEVEHELLTARPV